MHFPKRLEKQMERIQRRKYLSKKSMIIQALDEFLPRLEPATDKEHPESGERIVIVSEKAQVEKKPDEAVVKIGDGSGGNGN